MKKLIVANWKMNPSTAKEAESLFDAVKAAFAKASASQRKGIEVVICPPFIYIPILARLPFRSLGVGGQNVSYREKGAYTGEISPLQLKDLGIEYVILGHSEVRNYLNETDDVINKKVKESLNQKLKPIFCIGEKQGENKEEVLKEQITEGLKNISEAELKSLVIAYEPVWAIGTGNNCSTEETKSSVLLIRKIVAKLYNKESAENIMILYGGSVNSSNASDYLKNGGVQGLLVGGASLNAEDFIKIVKSAK